MIGAGKEPLDGSDLDMVDASLLSASDHQGNMLWRPTGLSDWYRLPVVVFDLWQAMQSGIGAAIKPWDWWRAKGSRDRTHEWETTYNGHPEGRARCGFVAPAGIEWEREDDFQCSACVASAKHPERVASTAPVIHEAVKAPAIVTPGRVRFKVDGQYVEAPPHGSPEQPDQPADHGRGSPVPDPEPHRRPYQPFVEDV